jgi:endonuclease/exonuclease/phosphatase family metal-dependent hydrolase
MIQVRVMTWNLWWRFGDWERRREAILQVLRDEQPDICGLQEVWSSSGTNLAALLAEELGMHAAFCAPSDQERWHKRVNDTSAGFGVAVLSRWPIRDEQGFDLVHDPSRPYFSVAIDAPHATVPFVTTHLSAPPVGTSVRRMAQLDQIAKHVAALPVTNHPPVITGDFNAEPESDEVRKFGGTLTEPFVDGQIFLDAWRYAPHNDPGFTWSRENPYVARGMDPSSRIDYIHVVPRWDAPGHIKSVRLAGTKPVGNVWASDHFAVIAELSE